MDNNIPYIEEIIPIIVSIASPDQIILFGSYARGDNTEKSDIDLLILKKGLKNGFDIIDSTAPEAYTVLLCDCTAFTTIFLLNIFHNILLILLFLFPLLLHS
jgi:hypothetical protein